MMTPLDELLEDIAAGTGVQPGVFAPVREKVSALLERAADFSTARDQFNRRDEAQEPEGDLAPPALAALIHEATGHRGLEQRPALHLTHDIDALAELTAVGARSLRRRAQILRWTLRFGQAREVERHIETSLGKSRVDRVIRTLDTGRGIPRTLFTIDVAEDLYDADPVENPELVNHLRAQAAHGLNMGYHPGFNVNSAQRLAAGKRAIEAKYGVKIDRVRFHYLRLTSRQTFADIDIAGFRFDSSIGYSRRRGARYGLHVPYRLPVGPQGTAFTEVPLLFMDDETAYAGRTTLAATCEFLDWVQRFGARGTILFHPEKEQSAERVACMLDECRKRGIPLVDMPDVAGARQASSP